MSASLSGFETRLESVEGLLGQLLARQPALHGSPREVTTAVVTGRLVGKPALLRSICDTVTVGAEGKPGTTEMLPRFNHATPQSYLIASTYPRGRFACLCSHRQRLRRKQVVFGSLVFSHETATEEHLPQCPANQILASRDRSEKIGLTYIGLRRLLNSAVQPTFAMPSGAGGWGLSPSFTYYPTVDAKTAPTFRILTLIYDAMYFVRLGEKERWEENFVPTAVSVILRLLQTNKASARAVDANNKSMAHYVTDCIRANLFDSPNDANRHLEVLLDLLECLLVNKTPLNDHDLSGQTPLSTMFDFAYAADIDPLPAAAAELILRSDAEAKVACLVRPIPSVHPTILRLSQGDTRASGPVEIVRFLSCSAAIAEAYGCGPLSLAVLSNNAEQVEHLVRNHPATLAERNIFGHTPLHLAADKPACLRHLVRAADARLLNQKNCDNGFGMSALEAALQFSGLHCRDRTNNPDRACRRCNCAECAVILLQADCAIPIPANLTTLFSGASKRCKLRYIRHMKSRRERLKQLALKKLPTKEIARLNLAPDRVLDSLATQVFQSLQDHGVQIPGALAVDPWPSSVYKSLRDPHSAGLFYKLGFQDTESWTKADAPELDTSDTPMRDLDYLHWLATHGAFSGQLTSFESARDIFTINSIFWRLGGDLGRSWIFKPIHPAASHARSRSFPLDGRIAWVHQVNSAVLPARIADNCCCKCSPGGCTPLISLLKGVPKLRTYAFGARPRPFRKYGLAKKTGCPGESVSDEDPLLTVPARLTEYFELFGADLDVSHHMAVLRYVTFTALGIPHICCDPRAWRRHRARTPEEVAEFEDEHAYELNLLDELLEEFEGQVMAVLQDPKQGIEGVIRFWNETWVTRMSEVLNRLESDDLADDEKRGAEEIGVVWDMPKPPEVSESLEISYDKGSLEYWMHELEKIKAEWL